MNIFQRSLQVPVENSAPATPVAKKSRLVPSGFYNIWQKYTAKKKLLVKSRLAADVLWKIWLKLCFGGWGDFKKIWKSARRSRADFQIFLKSPHPPKHNLGAKFSKARQLRDDFSINTPTLHVHAQSHSDSINTYFLMATDVFMQSLLLLKLLIVTFLGGGSRQFAA